MVVKFFTYSRHCSVDTELISRNYNSKKCFNCFLSGSKVYRQFCRSFAFELTPGQWSCCTEGRMSAFCEFQQHFFRNVIPDSLWTFSAEYHFFSELCPINDHCPIPNLLASTFTTPAFAKHSSLLSFLSQEMSLNIDINRILLVKVAGVCPKLLSRSLILPQTCNVVNPGKMFHSNSVGSPLIPSYSLCSFCRL